MARWIAFVACTLSLTACCGQVREERDAARESFDRAARALANARDELRACRDNCPPPPSSEPRPIGVPAPLEEPGAGAASAPRHGMQLPANFDGFVLEGGGKVFGCFTVVSNETEEFWWFTSSVSKLPDSFVMRKATLGEPRCASLPVREVYVRTPFDERLIEVEVKDFAYRLVSGKQHIGYMKRTKDAHLWYSVTKDAFELLDTATSLTFEKNGDSGKLKLYVAKDVRKKL
jgi:hypothetical protein